MESWRKVWRNGILPLISLEGLMALRRALRDNDPRLVQGTTTTPPPSYCVQDWPVEAACAISFCGWQGDDLNTVSEVEEYFVRMCFEIDNLLEEPAVCRWFINWWDENPRKKVIPELLSEVELAIEAHCELIPDFIVGG